MMARFLPRFTVRCLITAVVIAVLAWPASTALIWLEYRRRAIQNEEICEVLASEIKVITSEAEEFKGDPYYRAVLDFDLKRRRSAIADASRQALRYREAMRRPWRSLLEEPGSSE
jgi:bifunctional pyridoxal-dependent enzyme with beta-cystathionase and maltose regulon repressor activities